MPTLPSIKENSQLKIAPTIDNNVKPAATIINVGKSQVRLRQKTPKTDDSKRKTWTKRLTQFMRIGTSTSNDDVAFNNPAISLDIIREKNPKGIIKTLRNGLSFEADNVGIIPQILPNINQPLVSTAIINENVCLLFKKIPQVFMLTLNSGDGDCNNKLKYHDTWYTRVESFVLYPLKIKQNSHGDIFVSGYIYESKEETSKRFLISKYDKNQKFLLKTRRYAYSRFSDFDIDSDDNLIITSAAHDKDNIYHFSKISPDFQKSIYKFNISTNSMIYIPMRIVLNACNNRSWLVAIKADDSGLYHPRLLSFNSAIKQTPNMTREAFMDDVDINLWSSEGFSPAKIVKLSNNFMLALDEHTNALHSISWDATNQIPDAVQITKDHDLLFEDLCSNENGVAYIFTETFIYRIRQEFVI